MKYTYHLQPFLLVGFFIIKSIVLQGCNLQLDAQNMRANQKQQEKHKPSSKKKETDNVPENFFCPIGQEIMNDPVITEDGHSYERIAIEEWFKKGNITSPLTGKNLRTKNLISNYALRNAIVEFKQKQLKKESVKDKGDKNELNEKLVEERKDMIYSPLLDSVLNNKKNKLDITETISIIGECIGLGKQRVDKLKLYKDKYERSIAVLGNTGSGKSTFLNYINGCSMQMVQEGEKKDLIGVKPMHKGGEAKPIAEIGHCMDSSKTFIPDLIFSEKSNTIYIDCPGFLDTRTSAINIANTVNTKNILNEVENLSIIVIIDIGSILSDRGKGLKDMLNILYRFFGSEEALIENKGSLLIGVSKLSMRDRRGFESLISLKKYLREGESEESRLLNELSDNIFSYDPLDEPIDRGWRKVEILEKINNLAPIKDSKSLFKTVLTAEDKISLRRISDKIGESIEDALSKDVKILTIANFREAARNIEYLECLKIIESKDVDESVEHENKLIIKKLKELFETIKLRCDSKNFTEADRLLAILNDTAPLFTFDIKKELNFDSLKEHMEALKEEERKRKEKEYQEEQERLQLLDTNKKLATKTEHLLSAQIELNKRLESMHNINDDIRQELMAQTRKIDDERKKREQMEKQLEQEKKKREELEKKAKIDKSKQEALEKQKAEERLQQKALEQQKEYEKKLKQEREKAEMEAGKLMQEIKQKGDKEKKLQQEREKEEYKKQQEKEKMKKAGDKSDREAKIRALRGKYRNNNEFYHQQVLCTISDLIEYAHIHENFRETLQKVFFDVSISLQYVHIYCEFHYDIVNSWGPYVIYLRNEHNGGYNWWKGHGANNSGWGKYVNNWEIGDYKVESSFGNFSIAAGKGAEKVKSNIPL